MIVWLTEYWPTESPSPKFASLLRSVFILWGYHCRYFATPLSVNNPSIAIDWQSVKFISESLITQVSVFTI